jgi:M6 family metalloprotease-like protein
MKKYLVCWTAVLLFFAPFETKAVPASPYPVEYKQPDGSTVTIFPKGDERVHWATSADGYTLLLNPSGFYEYAKKAVSGDVTLSGVRAHNPGKRTPEETVLLKSLTKDLRYSREQINTLKQVWKAGKIPLNSEQLKAQTATGNVRAPLILVQFPGKPFTRMKQEFELLMNQPRYTATTDGAITGSVYDYFYDNSYGQLEFQVDVFGPYMLENPVAYYDFNSGGDHVAMAREAALAAAADGCNFADYDSNGDGLVDAMHIVFAGYGQEAGAPTGDAIWSHAAGVYTENYDRLTINNKTLYSYSCSPELRDTHGSNISHIGVIVHEMSHVFGLPDFYDTDYEKQGQAVDTGEWDVMARGSWNDNGRTPAGHNAWSKGYLGWVPMDELVSAAEIILPNPADKCVVYRINTTTPGEYFLLENRQQQGWDAYIPSSGMLIYHVDENMNWNDNCLNCRPEHRGLYIKQAGGGANSSNTNRVNDAYPSARGNTAFTDTSVPNSRSWAGDNTGKPIMLITHNTEDRTVSFSFMEVPDSYDAALTRLVDLPAISYREGTREIQVELENRGKAFIGATVTWTIDGQAQTPCQWTGSLLFAQKEILTIGSANLTLGVHTLSVSVTLAGDEHADNNTVHAAIEIKASETLPYNTEFDGSLSGWESQDFEGNVGWLWADLSQYWFLTVKTTSQANGYALCGIPPENTSDPSMTAKTALLSPPFDFTEVENAIDLSFEWAAISEAEASLTLQASTDHFQEHIANIWSQALSFGSPGSTADVSPVLDISAFAGEPNVRIRFLYEGFWPFGYVIDDVKLFTSNTPKLESLTVSPGVLSPVFNPGITAYAVRVAHEVSSIDIGAVAMRPSDIVSGTGTKLLEEGKNTFSVTVAAPGGSEQKTYTVVVYRSRPALQVPFTENFESAAPLWAIENGSYTNQWHIGTATAASGNYSAYISNDGGASNAYSVALPSAVSLYCDVDFTPLTDDSYIYRLTFDWKGLGESGCDYLEVFLTGTEAGETSTYLGTFLSSDSWQKAAVNLPGSYFYSGTTMRLVFRWINDFSYGIQPPTAIDNVCIQSVAPDEAMLGSLSVSKGFLSPYFDSNTFSYDVTVNNSVTDIEIQATAIRSIDKVSGTGIYPLNLGDNPFEIVVSNPAGTVQNSYKIRVNREKPLFSVPFTEDFESANNLWNFANGTERNQWIIGSAASASGNYSAYISKDGASYGYNANTPSVVHLFTGIYFTPYTGNGYYQLSFDWKGMGGSFDCLKVYLANTYTEPVAGVESYGELLGQFYHAPGWGKAVINIDGYNMESVKRLVFTWTNTYSGVQPPAAIDNVALKFVSASDAALSSLSVNTGTLSPAFSPNTFHYTVNMDKSVSQIRLEAEANNPKATVVGANETLNLNVGANTFHVLVIAEDLNSRNTYSVVVNRGGTGIQNPKNAIKVYPVPTTGKVYIENADDTELILYNLPGEILLRTRQNSIDLSAYPDGTYLLQAGSRKIKVVKH